MNNESLEAQPGLAFKLRTITQSAHESTESGTLIKKIFSGTVTEQQYWLYLWSLNQIYTELEFALDNNKSHPAISALYFPELFRRETLARDLKTWADFKTDIPVLLQQEVLSYSHHLKRIGEESPLLLVPHAYVRYLGDLSGGQILGKNLSRKYPNPDGLNFYNFPLITNPTEMKTLYRKQLDFVGQTYPDKINILGQEAILAFEYNGKVFSAIP